MVQDLVAKKKKREREEEERGGEEGGEGVIGEGVKTKSIDIKLSGGDKSDGDIKWI